MNTLTASSIFNDTAQLRSPLLTGIAYSNTPCASTQVHHLIPRELWGMSLLEGSPALLASGGMENQLNLMELPATSAGAVASRLALHSGSHPGYTLFVTKRLQEINVTYKSTEATLGKAAAEAQLLDGITGLQMELRMGLDRSTPGLQLSLTTSDPAHDATSPENKAFHAAAAASGLSAVIDEVNINPRSAYPTQGRTQEACEAQMEALTREELEVTARKLREAAWQNIPEHQRPSDNGGRILANEGLDEIIAGQAALRSRSQTQQAIISNTPAEAANSGVIDYLTQTAKEHPYATLAVGTVATVGLGFATGIIPPLAPATAQAATTTAAIMGVAATTVILSSNEAGAAIPIPGEMNRGSDDIGTRSDVDHISWRFSGIRAGDPANSPEALYVRDIAASREGGPLQHAQGHLLLKADGSIIRSEQFNRPWDMNPQIEGGNNGNAIGVIVEGTDTLTKAQRETLTTLNTKLGDLRGSTSMLSPAGVKEEMAWGGTTPTDPAFVQSPVMRQRMQSSISAAAP